MELRRLSGDLIEIYKFIRGVNKMISCSLFPRIVESKNRGHGFKVRRERFKKDLRGNYRSERVAYVDKLLEEVVEEGRITIFKCQLERYRDRIGRIWKDMGQV